MRPALFLVPLLMLTACKPAEKPADLATSSEAAAADSAVYTGTSPVALADESPAAEVSCKDEVGAAAAKKLVDQCLAVSPATHPPCNAENACSLIRSEIKRSCDMLPADEQIPAECAL
ncbi:MAG: hypothetical protein JF615_15590 [Asticcacaulis sp.]|nr:hypothetical protein [Asticcacaulis sp.]